MIPEGSGWPLWPLPIASGSPHPANLSSVSTDLLFYAFHTSGILHRVASCTGFLRSVLCFLAGRAAARVSTSHGRVCAPSADTRRQGGRSSVDGCSPFLAEGVTGFRGSASPGAHACPRLTPTRRLSRRPPSSTTQSSSTPVPCSSGSSPSLWSTRKLWRPPRCT